MEKLYHSLEELVKEMFGEGTRIVRMDRVHGGDINDAYRVSLSSGDPVFVNTNTRKNLRFFLSEARGLRALGA